MTKGTVQRDFWPPAFFIIWTSLGHRNVQIWLSFCWVIRIFMINIPRGVNLPGVSYCAESISPGYHTPASNFLRFVMKSPKGLPWWVNLAGVSYCAESISPGMMPREVNKNPPKHDSPEYDTPGVNARSSQLCPPIPTPALRVKFSWPRMFLLFSSSKLARF